MITYGRVMALLHLRLLPLTLLRKLLLLLLLIHHALAGVIVKKQEIVCGLRVILCLQGRQRVVVRDNRLVVGVRGFGSRRCRCCGMLMTLVSLLKLLLFHLMKLSDLRPFFIIEYVRRSISPVVIHHLSHTAT